MWSRVVRLYSKMSSSQSQLIPDFAPGPLDYYRKRASFDWKKLKVFLESEEIIQFQNDLHEMFEAHPEFQKDLLSYSLDKERNKAARESLARKNIELLDLSSILGDLRRAPAMLKTTMQLCPSSTIKYSVGEQLFSSVIRTMGTARHAHYLDLLEDGKIFGCFCLTEIGHGTNTKGMQTRATYDKNRQKFIVHSPDFEAAKCWAGGLGQMATHCAVYAQLYIGDVHYGLHTFVVPIRDPLTLLPYPGVIVGDMGEKIGLNGIDNGFVMFDNYLIPHENLLNKSADVTLEGTYVTPFKNDKARHGAALGSLSVGRVNITGICNFYGIKALTIAIRYAGVRKQFGPDGQNEVPILEYQTHQHRLLPYLAASYVIGNFANFIIQRVYQFTIDSILGNDIESLPELGMEIHALSSASKPLAGWVFRDAIQESREACGGHGYLKAAGIGDVRNDHDANCTYEGENHVLIQQTSNWLLKFWPMIEKRQKISTPLQSANFLSNGLDILKHKFEANSLEEVARPEQIIDAFQWLVCFFLRETKNKIDSLPNKNESDQFWAKNNTQVFHGKNLGIVFIQHYFLQRMLLLIEEADDKPIKTVLLRLFSLYGLWSLEKFLASLYQGGYAEGSKPTQLVQEGILKLCTEIKDDAVSLVDAVAPPDFILNSVLGSSDGQVYKRLQSVILRSPMALSRPDWWQDIVHWKSNIKNKL